MTEKKRKAPTTDVSAAADGFHPFADGTAARTIAGLTVENGIDRIGLHGSLDITRDRPGLAQARLLRETFAAIVQALEAEDLPERVAVAEDAPPRTVANPFA